MTSAGSYLAANWLQFTALIVWSQVYICLGSEEKEQVYQALGWSYQRDHLPEMFSLTQWPSNFPMWQNHQEGYESTDHWAPPPRNSDSVGLGWETKNVNISNVPKWCWWCRSQAVCWESLASEYKRGHCNNQLWSLLCAPSSSRVWVSVPAAPLKEWGRTADARECAHSACWVPHSLWVLCTYLLIYFSTRQLYVLGTSQMRKLSHREVKSLG